MSSKGENRCHPALQPRGLRYCMLLIVLAIGLNLLAQELPDAPTPQTTPAPATQPAPSGQQSPNASAPGQTNAPADGSKLPAQQPPPPQVKTVPPGSVPQDNEGSREQLFTLIRLVNFVLVPVTVKDVSGHLVEGLLPNDFSVYEDNVRQQLKFFTSDPFPLSAAVVFDLALPNSEVKKLDKTLPALTGAFSQFDEIALFTYGNTVRKMQDFSAADANTVSASLRKLKHETGRTGGVPVVGGPLGSGPSVNGRSVDPNVPVVQTWTKESSVLNDAILAAANELSRRDPTRRKILFIISDGREVGSRATYSDVLKVLLSNQITVYAVGVSGAAIPGYGDLQKVRVPGLGYGNILPKYASATGGQVFNEISPQAIESAYSRVTQEARNQYTLGYTTPATPSGAYRSIEVRVNRPNLRVYAKDGYYPLPPPR
ncbi:MAG: VWA domain-containing protein [Terriglobales bacterium]